ncbi:MAG: class I SAM-dependent methyltransferase [Microthrixaceae bacterium]
MVDRSDDESIAEWECHADWWQREFTGGADAEYAEQILPLIDASLPSSGRVLDLGSGDGQVTRLVADRVGLAVGVDAVRAQVEHAAALGSGSFLQARLSDLPVRSGSCRAVVACLVLEHVADLDTAMAEAARVLESDGRLVVVINHPILQTPGSGWIDDQLVDPPEQYWRIGPYLPEVTTVEEVDDGVDLTFHHRPLHRYVNGASACGLLLEHLEEPVPPRSYLERYWSFPAAVTVPRLALLRFRKLG